MRGQTAKKVLSENYVATRPYEATKKWKANKPHMCWKCQKDKPTFGGHIKTYVGGPMKFICRDCLEEKESKK